MELSYRLLLIQLLISIVSFPCRSNSKKYFERFVNLVFNQIYLTDCTQSTFVYCSCLFLGSRTVLSLNLFLFVFLCVVIQLLLLIIIKKLPVSNSLFIVLLACVVFFLFLLFLRLGICVEVDVDRISILTMYLKKLQTFQFWCFQRKVQIGIREHFY